MRAATAAITDCARGRLRSESDSLQNLALSYDTSEVRENRRETPQPPNDLRPAPDTLVEG